MFPKLTKGHLTGTIVASALTAAGTATAADMVALLLPGQAAQRRFGEGPLRQRIWLRCYCRRM